MIDEEKEEQLKDDSLRLIVTIMILGILLVAISLFLIFAKKFPAIENKRKPTFTVVEKTSEERVIEPNSEVIKAMQEKDKEAVDQALLHQYQDINDECVGIIRIDGTVLDHPLMQSKTNEAFYLSHDILKEKNGHGIPFLTLDSDLNKCGYNNVIYGHNMRWESKDVFYALAGYENIDYYKEHPIVEVVVDGQTRQYLVFAYFISDNEDEDAFRYWMYHDLSTDQKFKAYMDEVYKRNWLFTDIPVDKDDNFITLSSCSMELEGLGTNRMVVMARLLREGEDITGYLECATIDPAPYLPEKLR